MNNRVKEIRKNLKLSQESFGSRLGVTKAAISRIEKGERSLTDQMILSICREFDVNEKWLRDGVGDIFMLEEENELNELRKKYNLDDLDMQIMREYLKLTPENRNFLKTYFKNIFGNEESKVMTKEELDELEIQKELAEFEEAVRTQKNRDKNNLSNINYLENMDYFKEKKPA